MNIATLRWPELFNFLGCDCVYSFHGQGDQNVSRSVPQLVPRSCRSAAAGCGRYDPMDSSACSSLIRSFCRPSIDFLLLLPPRVCPSVWVCLSLSLGLCIWCQFRWLDGKFSGSRAWPVHYTVMTSRVHLFFSSTCLVVVSSLTCSDSEINTHVRPHSTRPQPGQRFHLIQSK